MSRPRVELVVCLTLLIAIFILSLVLRISVPWSHVFEGNWVKFTDNDAYFYIRLLDNLSHHFPQMSSFDPYNIYPAGRDLRQEPVFYVYMMGFFCWLFGGGVPSQHLVDLVGVYFPAVMGALLVFPIFFIGKLVANRWAGLVAALLIALMPGEFLARTQLGNTDIHVAEIFFTAFFVLFTILAVRQGSNLSMPLQPGRDNRRLALSVLYAALAGISLGAYLLSWRGSLFFILISFTWMVVQSISDRFHGRSSIYLALVCFTSYLVALLASLTSAAAEIARIPLLAALLSSVLLPALAELTGRFKWRALYYLVLVAGLGAAGMLAINTISPQLFNTSLTAIKQFFIWNTGSGIAEDQPLLINNGAFTFGLLWGNYTLASILALPAFFIIAYKAIREGETGSVLLTVWSLVILLATLAMRRFAYYMAVNVAILAGYSGWLILRSFGLQPAADAPVPDSLAGKSPKKGRKKDKRKRDAGGQPYVKSPALAAIGVVIVLVLCIYPNTGPLPGGDRPFFEVASQALFTPSDGWCESMDWLRDKSPEPFGDPQYYYEYYSTPSQLSNRAASYSVVSWWDFGYWITRIGHRVPLSNPASAKLGEQNLLLAASSQEAAKISAGWNMKYLIVDNYLIDWRSGFDVLADNAGQPSSRYYEIYYRQQNGKLVPTLLYYPDYYDTLAVRLYCFNGGSYMPKETAVISWEPAQDSDGQPYKEITGLKTFPSYSEAASFMAAQKTGNFRIVGKEPTVSPIALDELPGFQLTFASTHRAQIGTTNIPEVKIFEYTGGAQSQ